MSTILTMAEQDKLVAQSRLKDLYTNDYLNDEYNDNFKTIKELFFNNSIIRTKQFNVGTNMFSTVSDTLSAFVGNPITDINVNIDKQVIDYSSVGKAIFGLKRVDNGTINGEMKVYHIPAENHVLSDGTNKVYTMYKNIDNNDVIYYLLKQEFLVGTIENTLYKLDKLVDKYGSEVPLDSIIETRALQPIMRTGLTIPAIFYIEMNPIDGIQSELDKIKNMVYSLDRKAVMFETQFLGEIEQYKIFENIQIPQNAIRADGTVDVAKMGKIVATDSSLGATGNIKYVSNRNDLINDAINYEQTQVRKISSATSIPVDFLGINSTSAISGEAREMMMGAFVKKVQGYRDVMNKILTEILVLFEGQKDSYGNKITSSIIWNDILIKNEKDLAEELKIAREAGIISQYTGIQKYQGLLNPEDIEKEIELINQSNNADQIQPDTNTSND